MGCKMKIIIDIPEVFYEALKKADEMVSGRHSGKTLVSVIFDAVAQDIALPKGHGDLIDVNGKITVSIYDGQYEEWGEKTLTVLEALNRWSDEGVTVKDVVIPADDAESERREKEKIDNLYQGV